MLLSHPRYICIIRDDDVTTVQMISTHIPSGEYVWSPGLPDDGLNVISATVTPDGMIHGIAGDMGCLHVSRLIGSDLWDVQEITRSDSEMAFYGIWYTGVDDMINVAGRIGPHGFTHMYNLDPASSAATHGVWIDNTLFGACLTVRGHTAVVTFAAGPLDSRGVGLYDLHREEFFCARMMFPNTLCACLTDSHLYIMRDRFGPCIYIIDIIHKKRQSRIDVPNVPHMPSGHALMYLNNSLVLCLRESPTVLSFYSYDDAKRVWHKIQ